jgi:hypothetical protein
MLNYARWMECGKKSTKCMADFAKIIGTTKMYTQPFRVNGTKKGQQEGEGYATDSKISAAYCKRYIWTLNIPSDSATNGRQVIRDWKVWKKDERRVRELHTFGGISRIVPPAKQYYEKCNGTEL